MTYGKIKYDGEKDQWICHLDIHTTLVCDSKHVLEGYLDWLENVKGKSDDRLCD